MTATGTPPDRQGDDGIASPARPLRLLPAWSSPARVFGDNLTDFLLGSTVPEVTTTSPRNHAFWRNVELQAPIPWRGMMDSLLVHLGLVSFLVAASTWPQPRVHLQARFYRVQTGVQLSLYLPELRGAPVVRAQRGKADPVPARQAIQSLPEEPDNLHQTIVTPPKLKLPHDLELPNLVAYKVAPPAAPAAPVVPIPVASPPAAPAKPSPEIVHLQPLRALPHSPPSATPPAPKVSSLLKSAEPDVAQLLPPRAEPLLALPPVLVPPAVKPKPAIVLAKPERVPSRAQPEAASPAPKIRTAPQESAADLAKLFSTHTAPAPPPSEPPREAPQVVALSTHPAAVETPVKIPEGNRRGEFAASPTGRLGATGSPGGGGDAARGGAQHSEGKVEGKLNAPPGISVQAPPPGAPPVDAPLPAAPSASATADATVGQPGADTDLRSKLMAAMRTPAIASAPPRRPAMEESPKPRNELENHVFAGRRAYTLVANTPNLNSNLGSWIIRYVERNQGLAASPIAAPEVVRKSDPAYPSELIKDGIQGTVILSAIIRADGTVGDISVVKSLDPQLDRNAVEAFSQWVFRPALKDGKAVDLEALITVPFRAKPIHY